MKKIVFITILTILIFTFGGCGSSNSSNESSIVDNLQINSVEISKNLVNENSLQNLMVYLPADYDTSSSKYPVIYFLGGYGDISNYWFDNTYGFSIQTSMDNLIKSSNTKSMIIVVISGKNVFNGSFYTNSPITGNWENYIVNEVVPTIDSKYRTLNSKDSRGIAGHSMGGFGALSIAMKYPSIFSSVYALSPGLFDQNGLEDFLFPTETEKSAFLSYFDSLDSLDSSLAASQRDLRIAEMKKDSWKYIRDVYGFAFAGNSQTSTFMDCPYENLNGNIQPSQNISKWNAGYGNLSDKINAYTLNSSKLKAIGFEVGAQDEYSWLVRGNDYFYTELTNAGISSTFTKFQGTHENKLKERFENYLVPFFNQNLKFE